MVVPNGKKNIPGKSSIHMKLEKNAAGKTVPNSKNLYGTKNILDHHSSKLYLRKNIQHGNHSTILVVIVMMGKDSKDLIIPKSFQMTRPEVMITDLIITIEKIQRVDLVMDLKDLYGLMNLEKLMMMARKQQMKVVSRIQKVLKKPSMKNKKPMRPIRMMVKVK